MRKIVYVFLTVIISVLVAVSASAVTAPEIIEGTTIRMQEPLGIRVFASIDAKVVKDSLPGELEYGFITTRKLFLQGKRMSNAEFTFDSGVYYIKGVSYGLEDGRMVDKYFAKDDEDIYFAGYYYGLKPENYREVFVTRPYVIDKGEISYGEPVELCLYEQAREIKYNEEKYNMLAPDQKQVIDSIVNYYVPERSEYRIISEVETVENFNGTYSFLYNVIDPFAGEKIWDVPGRKQADSVSELGEAPKAGTIVGVKYDYVEDAYDDTVKGNILSEVKRYIDLDNLTYCDVLSEACCLRSVTESCITELKINENTRFVVLEKYNTLEETFRNATINQCGSIADVSANPYFEDTYSFYNRYVDTYRVDLSHAKSYVSFDDEGVCEYVIIYDDEDLIHKLVDNTCSKHPFLQTLKESYDHVEKIAYSDYALSALQNKMLTCISVIMRDVLQFGDNSGTSGYYLTNCADILKTAKASRAACTTFTDQQYDMFENALSAGINTQVENFLKTYFKVDFGYEIKIPEENLTLIEVLTRGNAQLKKLRLANALQKEARNILVDCINYVLVDAQTIVITKDYVVEVYDSHVQSIKNVLMNQMTDTERSNFVNILMNERNIDKDVQDFLMDYFDIDPSKITG